MELKRRVRDRMYFVLLIVWNIATVLFGQDLDCTNDFVKQMSCHLKAQNCTAYKLTLSKNGHPRNIFNCTFEQCHVGQCCCSVDVDRLIPLETYNAKVLKGGIITHSKNISVSDSIKPQTPTITTVKESNGNIQVKWKTNINGVLNEELISYLAYRKKGDTGKVFKEVKPTTNNGENCYEILGRDLEPSTTYMFSVKSSLNLDSDISEEYEFTTPMSPYTLPLVTTISLSFAAVITTAAVYVCYVKLKRKWGDTVAKSPNPKLLITHQTEQEVLKPLPLLISSVCVEPLVPEDSKPWSKESLRDISCLSPQQSSGISTGSSCLSYAHTEPAEIIACVQDALTKAFANISPVSPMTTNPLTESIKDSGLLSLPYNPCDVRDDGMSSGSSGFDNKTYSILVPCCPHQNVTDSTEVQMQAEMLCDSAYHSSAGNGVTCFVQQAPADLLVDLLPVALSTIPTDMSYQQCAIDSGGFSCPEDSGLSSASSGTNPVGEGRCGSFDEAVCGAATPHGKAEGVAVFDENPSCCGVPAGSGSLPPVDDDYQPFHNLVEDSEALFSEERSAEKEEHLNKYADDSITQRPQSVLSPVFINSVQGGQCLSELQRPFLSLIPAEQSPSLIIDSGYKAVMDMC